MTLAQRIDTTGTMSERGRGVAGKLDLRRAGRGPRQRDRSPRSQARQHLLGPGSRRRWRSPRKLLDFGIAKLNDLKGGERQDQDRRADGHAVVHVTRAVPGQRRHRSPRGPLLARLHLLRAAHRAAAVRDGERRRGHRDAPLRGARAAIDPWRRNLTRHGRAHHVVARQGAREAAADGTRALATILEQLVDEHGGSSASGFARWSRKEAAVVPRITGMAPTPGSSPRTPVATISANQPTTLSGAASQTVARPPKSRVGVALGLGGVAVVAAVVAIAFGVMGGTTSSTIVVPTPSASPVTPTSVSPPAPAALAPVPAPVPTPAPPVETPAPFPVTKPTSTMPPAKPVAKTVKRPTKPDVKPAKKLDNADDSDLPIEKSVQ